MSYETELTNELVANGYQRRYQRRDLKGCSLDELALLKQEVVANKGWTAAARAAAAAAKGYKRGSPQRKKAAAKIRASRNNPPIEAHGVMGMKSKPWRKTFKSADHLNKWVEKTGAEVHATREVG